MSNKVWLCLFVSFNFVGILSLYSQTTPPNYERRQTSADPFGIRPGSSFTASSGGTGLHGKTKKEGISADFSEALQLIEGNHFSGRGLSRDKLAEAAIDSMLRTLDPHSNYLNSEEFQELLGEHESEYFGTGSSISSFEKRGILGIHIVSLYPGSPASKAGLGYGDRILEIDGVGIVGWPLETVRNRMRGRRGTFVTLKVEKADTGNSETLEIQRGRVAQPTISNTFMLNSSVGYIDLSGGFSYTTLSELEVSLADLHRQNMKSLVLDLRGNGGGILDQAVSAAEKFLPFGALIVTQRGRLPSEDRTWRSQNRNPETVPIVVLVDEGTASASEVLAGAFQDNDRALIIGEKTFGKGLVQSVLELPGGTGLTLTTAKYFTPSGRSIQRDYDNGSLYDYFNHKHSIVDVAEPMVISRTVTNRKVYGGNGITPDQTMPTDDIDAGKISMIDPIFFFVRDYMNGTDASASSARDSVRQRIIFGESPVDDSVLSAFSVFVEREKSWKIPIGAIQKESAFVRSRIAYNLALASFGVHSADRVRTASDPKIAAAIALLPKSQELALSANRSRIKISMQTPSPK